MNVSALYDSLMAELGGSFPNIIGAVAILFAGWLVALGARFLVRRLLGRVNVNQRMRASTESKIDLEAGAGTAAFWIVLLLALVAFFNTLDLPQVSQPLASMIARVLTYLPNLLAGALLALLAWALATLFRTLASRGLKATRIDEKLSTEAGVRPVSESLGHVVYGLTLLLFLPAILGALELDGLLLPVQGVVDRVLDILPNAAAAAILGFVGWVVARIVRNLVTNILTTTGIDRLGRRIGLKGTMSLSGLIGLVVFVVVFVPAVIAALDALRIEAISVPATRMLETMMNAVPSLLGAALVLVVAFLIAEFVAGLVTSVLAGFGTDRVPEKLGLPRLLPESVTLTHVIGRITVVLIMIFAAIEAATMLGFATVSEQAAVVTRFGGQVLLGLLVIGLGLWLANVAHDTVVRTSRNGSPAMAGIARFAILALVLAMGLKAMGIADPIVILAFALPLGAVALAVALSFGLGGREIAARQMEEWMTHLRERKE